MTMHLPKLFGHYVNVTPSDSVNYTDGEADALWVGGAGNVVFIRPDGTPITVTGVLAGTLLPLKHKRINATNTTATLMVALYRRIGSP